jgi:hypothetical protein
MDIELLINTMNTNKINTFVDQNNSIENDINKNNNCNTQNCDCINNDDLYSQQSSEYNDVKEDHKCDDKCDNNNECPDNYGSYCIPYWKWQVYNTKYEYESIVCEMLIQDNVYDLFSIK